MQQRIKAYLGQVFDGHQILILGYGREGKSTYRFLRALFPEAPLTLADQGLGILEDEQIAADMHTDYYIGADYLDALQHCDFIIKSPGISVKDLDIPEGVIISSQTELFVGLFREQIIGVTGTKGKSTTASLIHHILSESGHHTFLLGNIGKPAFESIHELTEESLIVLEMSSHQLQFCRVSPKYAILLNLFQEHLDHYNSYHEYQDAKLNICRNQLKGDVCFYGRDNHLLADRMLEVESPAKKLSFGIDPESSIRLAQNHIHYVGGRWDLNPLDYHLKGEHNFVNMLAALAVVQETGISISNALVHSQSFKGLPHRMEYIGCVGDIHYYNDSIATIPEASLQAIEAIGNVDTLILGGYDRGINYDAYLSYLSTSSISNLILMGELSQKFNQHLGGYFPGRIYKAKDMKEAVELARLHTPAQGVCLLSPAASSYDQYQNFEDRGDQFKKWIQTT